MHSLVKEYRQSEGPPRFRKMGIFLLCRRVVLSTVAFFLSYKIHFNYFRRGLTLLVSIILSGRKARDTVSSTLDLVSSVLVAL